METRGRPTFDGDAGTLKPSLEGWKLELHGLPPGVDVTLKPSLEGWKRGDARLSMAMLEP